MEIRVIRIEQTVKPKTFRTKSKAITTRRASQSIAMDKENESRSDFEYSEESSSSLGFIKEVLIFGDDSWASFWISHLGHRSLDSSEEQSQRANSIEWERPVS